MAVSTCYSVEEIIAAVVNTDSYINKAADTGHFSFVDTVIDAGLALEQAGISETHMKILYLLWVQGLSQTETAELLGMKRNTVTKIEGRAVKKIQAVLSRWEAEQYV